ncbi:MAG TPA: thioesterase domain-containing protein [Micromonosporaceae bacterium]|nr:thioesterase domain-containing protein [Micromonosporaceae bacterium]
MTGGDDNVSRGLAGRRAAADPEAAWFVSPAPRPQAPVVLFCLPYAGAGPSVFHRWSQLLGPDVDVAAVALPGREGRFFEQPEWSVAELAGAVVARAGGRPYALYGHSMGAKVGFEVVRELRRRGAQLPGLVAFGGSRAPSRPHPLDGLSRVPDLELLRRLAEVGNLPAAVVEEPELRDLVMPAIRADFRWLDELAHPPEPPLPVPMRVFAGADDRLATPAELLHWLPHAGAGFRQRTLPGGHFFLVSDPTRLAAALRAELAVVTGTAAGPGLAAAPPEEDEVHVWYARVDRLAGPAGATAELARRVVAAYRDRATAGLRYAAGYGGAVVVVAVTRGHDVAVEVQPEGAAAGPGQPGEGGSAAADRPGPQAGWRLTRLPLPGAVAVVAQRRDAWRLCLEEVGPGHELAEPGGGPP